MSNRRTVSFKTSALCTSGRHLLCPIGHVRCDCSCHKPMTITAAQAVILKLAGARLWPDDKADQQQLVDQARKVDPLAPDLERATRVLGLLP